ncbi:ABC transporter substrate-binding protein [Enterovirga rhinocerotis]|uniref:Branched-chain amino acid transport system substrate-binding protein n=1 Tax=Enterovirga rhinocerotis TaxID=1339210 RepID=A0A4R7C6W1_9HYPH|nr:ABC transporter substrate-binding protein [Enterovirga rhinocerotis]TDR93692.1 branched-chain amino acid transport system substrate-binding protein [Enterovirga rhinocerotis]
MTRGLPSRRLVLAAAGSALAMPALLRQEARAQAGAPVKVGVLSDLSGQLSDYSGPTCVTAAEMAAEDMGGTVLGRPIQILAADHQNKADVGANLARGWFDREGVGAIADLPNSSVALAVQHLASERGKITLLSGPASGALMNEACSKTGFLWALDTYSNTVGPSRILMEQGKKTWFLIVADYAYGHQMRADLTKSVEKAGGKVLGVAQHPTGSPDFSSFLLQAQASGAQVIGLLNAGSDTINCVKQASEFGISSQQKFYLPGAVISDVHALGLEQAKGLLLMNGFYWDRNDESRVWSKRFFDKTKRMPGQIQASVYSSVLHYLRAMKEAKSEDGRVVAEAMRGMRVNDVFTKDGVIRPDGRLVHDFYIVEVKSPAESKYPWDYYKPVGEIAGAEAMQPLSETRCPYLKKT